MRLWMTIFAVCIFTIYGNAQTIPAYKAETLAQRIKNTDTLYIVNFWATWCGPCVKELPEFEKLRKAYEGKPVKIILVSLDFKEEYEKRIPWFIKKKEIKHEVVWLNETNANTFIPKIEPTWQGSIPATLIINARNEYRNFYEGTISAERLQPLIDKQLALE